MIWKIIDNMGFVTGSLFGLSMVMAVRQIFEVPFEEQGWNVIAWELSSLRFPAGIWIFLIAFALALGWRSYKRQAELNRTEQIDT